MNVFIKRINRYTTELTINDTKILMKNRKMLKRINIAERVVSNFGKILGGAFTAAAIIRFIGVAGHADFIAEAFLTDSWTLAEYIYKSVSSVVFGIIAYKLFKHSDFQESE